MISAIDRERIDTVLHGKEFRRIMRYAGEAVVKYRMIADGERILLGVSGGKDSLTSSSGTVRSAGGSRKSRKAQAVASPASNMANCGTSLRMTAACPPRRA